MEEKTRILIENLATKQLRLDIFKEYPNSIEILEIVKGVIEQTIQNLKDNPPQLDDGTSPKTTEELIDEIMASLELNVEEIIEIKAKTYARKGIDFATNQLKWLAKKFEL